MNLDITNRLVLICGPTTSGKTTLANRIKNESPVSSIVISHDEVLAKVNKNQSQEKIDYEFRMRFISEINAAICSDYSLIILDTLNIRNKALTSVLIILRALLKYTDEITLIKMNLPMDLQKEFILKRKEFKVGYEQWNPHELLLGLLEQRQIYCSSLGTLPYSFTTTREYEITNPKEVNIQFDLSLKR